MKNTAFYSLLKNSIRYGLFSLCVITAGGCSSSPPAPPIDTSVFTLPKCTPDGFLSFEYFKFSDNFDFIEFHKMLSATDDQIIKSEGTKCATAKNRENCIALLQSKSRYCMEQSVFKAPTPDENAFPCYYLVVTKGDSVNFISSPFQFKTFLEPIESVQEALFAVWALRDDVSCTDRTRGGVRVVEDGYEVLATGGAECGYVIRYVFKVKKEGEVLLKQSEIIKTPEPNCPYIIPPA